MKLINIFFLILILSGCSTRYEDDPLSMKLVSIKKRLSGTWDIKQILINGVDSTQLIYIDSLKIFSKYSFSSFNGPDSDHRQVLKIETYNSYLKYDRLNFYIGHGHIEFHWRGYSWDSLVIHKTIIPHGAINLFDGNISWTIQKLTKKDFHITDNYNNKKYEIFFHKN